MACRGNDPIVCELFAGVGGLSLGAARAGFEVRSAVDNDARTLGVHHRNFPHTRPVLRDIAALSGQDLLAASGLKAGELDGLIGGPPCQGFSTIGRRRLLDDRNFLFSDFFRLVAETQPRFFLAENVRGIVEQRNSAVVKGALRKVQRNYRVLGPLQIVASEYGAPTSRTRVFFVGLRKDVDDSAIDAQTFEPPTDIEPVVVGHALRGLPSQVAADWRSNPLGLTRRRPVVETSYLRKILADRPHRVGNPEALALIENKGLVTGHTGTLHSPELVKRYAALEEGSEDPITKSVRLIRGGFCPTLRAGTGIERGAFQAVRPIHYRLPRVITPREAARLQSFPDWFVFDVTKWHSFRQIGNSVPPVVAEAMLRPLCDFVHSSN